MYGKYAPHIYVHESLPDFHNKGFHPPENVGLQQDTSYFPATLCRQIQSRKARRPQSDNHTVLNAYRYFFQLKILWSKIKDIFHPCKPSFSMRSIITFRVRSVTRKRLSVRSFTSQTISSPAHTTYWFSLSKRENFLSRK